MLRVAPRAQHARGRVGPSEFQLAEDYAFTGHCNECTHSQVVPWNELGRAVCGSCSSTNVSMNGPMWVGPLHDVATLEAMADLADEWSWKETRPLVS